MTRDGNYRSKKLAPPLSRQTSNFRDSSFKLHVFLLLQRFSQPAFRINAGEREKGKKKKKGEEEKNPLTNPVTRLLIRTICSRNGK